MTLEEFANRLIPWVLPRVERQLREEATDTEVLDATYRAFGVTEPLFPEVEEVQWRSRETALVLASAWFQLIVLSLKDREVLELDSNLMAEVRSEIGEAFEDSFTMVPLAPNDPREILGSFAEEVPEFEVGGIRISQGNERFPLAASKS